MSEELQTNEVSHWLSTYGIITAERMLTRFHIRLNTQELMAAVKNPECVYHQLLQAPVRNVLNGIVLQQAKDYQVYAQKLYIDYLLSGEAGKEESSPGANTRVLLEENRQHLLKLIESFQKDEMLHLEQIAKVQKHIIEVSERWEEEFKVDVEKLQARFSSFSQERVKHILQWLLILPSGTDNLTLAKRVNLSESEIANLREGAQDTVQHLQTIELDLDNYLHATKDIAKKMDEYRLKFYECILTTMDLLTQLPDYRINKMQLVENQEQLNFDKNLGSREE